MPTKNQLPKSINLLDPVTTPEDTVSNIYGWVVNVGRYLLLTVEVVVLAVFFSRFYYDTKNNRLTNEINDIVAQLSLPSYRTVETRTNTLNSLIDRITVYTTQQQDRSRLIGGIMESVPSEVTFQSMTIDADNVTVNLFAEDSDNSRTVLREYERLLRQNPTYESVVLTISKSGEEFAGISVVVSLKLAQKVN